MSSMSISMINCDFGKRHYTVTKCYWNIYFMHLRNIAKFGGLTHRILFRTAKGKLRVDSIQGDKLTCNTKCFCSVFALGPQSRRNRVQSIALRKLYGFKKIDVNGRLTRKRCRNLIWVNPNIDQCRPTADQFTKIAKNRELVFTISIRNTIAIPLQLHNVL